MADTELTDEQKAAQEEAATAQAAADKAAADKIAAEKAAADKAAQDAKASGAKPRIVTFVTEHFPFVRGDVINLNHESFDQDEIAKIPKNAYVKGEVPFDELEPVETTEDDD